MIGQSKLIETITNYTYSTFPHSLILLGESGCGKHTLIKDSIQPLLNIDVIDITDKLNLETINEITLTVFPHIYTINCDDITIKEQNVILKFLEEPLADAFIILICSNKNTLLNTIINRCQLFTFNRYTDEELLTFTNDPTLLKIGRTPGKLIALKDVDVNALTNLCNLLITKSNQATLPNILSVANKIDWKNKGTGYNKDIFKYVYLDTLLTFVKEDNKYAQLYMLTTDVFNKMTVLHADEQRLFEQYLIDLKMLLRALNGN